MALSYQDYYSRLDRKLQDVGEFLQPDDVRNFIIRAVLLYSRDRPHVKMSEMTGDASSFDFSLPSDWVENFSLIRNGEVEYPVDDTTQTQNILDRSEWGIISKLVSGTRTLYFRFKTFIPANSKVARFEYIVPHTLNQSTNTISDIDSDAVIAKAASICYWALASKFAQHSDSTIEADVIDYQRKYEYYRELALSNESEYRSIMGIGEESKNSTAASVGVAIKDLDIQYAGGYLGDYLTHPTIIR